MAVAAAAIALSCGGETAPEDPPAGVRPTASWFAEVRPAGWDFEHRSGVDGGYYFPEHVGSGAVVFDYDGDGDRDLYLVDSGSHGSRAGSRSVGNRLFRQDAGGSFVDVTVAAGVGDTGYGMGAAIGDYDGDGDFDLFVTNYGPDVLYRNQGNGTFRDVTAEAGVAGDQWSTAACFAEVDGDGLPDLYVVTYVHYPEPVACTDDAGRPEYCGPMSFRGVPDLLYRNLGDGTFEDVSAEVGIGRRGAPGLGVVCQDLTGDGRVDVYVANDQDANDFWVNQAGAFANEATQRGAAVNGLGEPEASMGVALGDFEGDGDLDLALAHLDRETHTLLAGSAGGVFEDVTAQSGLGPPSFPHTGFGAVAADFDNDGDLDLAVANGRVTRRVTGPDGPAPAGYEDLGAYWRDYAEPNQLFVNRGDGRFEPAGSECGELCDRQEVSRGLVAEDLDGDGALDLLVTNCNGPARLYRNRIGAAGGYLVVDAGSGALGGAAYLEATDGVRLRPLLATESYLVGREPRAHFGLPPGARPTALTLVGPDGGRRRWLAPPHDRVLRVGGGGGA